jgi:hopanoid-associated phosphorylase
MIVAVTGLVREARIVQGPSVIAVTGGGDRAELEKRLSVVLAENNVSGIISVGVAGGLSPDFAPGSTVVGTAVVEGGVVDGVGRYPTDPDWMQRLWKAIPRSKPGLVAGSDSVITFRPEKTALFERTGAVAVDMESHVAARAARACRLPFAVLRVICDPADRTLPPAALVAMKPDGSLAYEAILRSVAARPAQLLGLMYLMRDSSAAFRTLLRCRDVLGDRLAGPDLG